VKHVSAARRPVEGAPVETGILGYNTTFRCGVGRLLLAHGRVRKLYPLMQFRQLRYFVKIVEAGSFSRASAAIHVAQPALSQQIAELEDRLGMKLLNRSARGVSPTAAGEVLFREASSILHQLDLLPMVARSQSGEPEGTVSVGIASSLAPTMIGSLIAHVKIALPKVKLKVSDGDSESLQHRVETSNLDLAVIYEDELVSNFAREPLFRQRLCLVGAQPFGESSKSSVTLEEVAKLPLALPGAPNGRRVLIDRNFAEHGLTANVVAEVDSLSSELLTVKTGIAHTLLPVANARNFLDQGLAGLLPVDADLHLTCSIISSSDFPLSRAGDAVRILLMEFITAELKDGHILGLELLK
jgi:LysR family nitrogen assimilation transcriptional regulator